MNTHLSLGVYGDCVCVSNLNDAFRIVGGLIVGFLYGAFKVYIQTG